MRCRRTAASNCSAVLKRPLKNRHRSLRSRYARAASAWLLVSRRMLFLACSLARPTAHRISGRLVMASRARPGSAKRTKMLHQLSSSATVRALLQLRKRSRVTKPPQPHWFLSSSKALSQSARRRQAWARLGRPGLCGCNTDGGKDGAKGRFRENPTHPWDLCYLWLIRPVPSKVGVRSPSDRSFVSVSRSQRRALCSRCTIPARPCGRLRRPSCTNFLPAAGSSRDRFRRSDTGRANTSRKRRPH